MERVRVLGVIPARLVSSRFPGKVLAKLDGRPLIEHVHARLASATLVDEVLVATDGREVAEVVEGFGGRAILVEDPCATGSDRVAAAVRGLQGDVVINLQADQPLIDPGDIDRAVEELTGDDRLSVTTLAYRASDPGDFESPDVVKVVTDTDGRALYFSRAPVPSSKQGADGIDWYLHHVGIYCFRRPALERFAALPRTELEKRESLEQLRVLESGMSMGVVVTDRQTPGVDREADIAHVEELLASL